MSNPSAAEIGEMLVAMLSGAVGETDAHWHRLVGPVEALPIWTNVESNWRVTPIATGEELRAIIAAIEIVRKQHPYVDG
jgi:hypothetical protein